MRADVHVQYINVDVLCRGGLSGKRVFSSTLSLSLSLIPFLLPIHIRSLSFLRLCFSAWGRRGEGCDSDEEEDEGFGELLEQSLPASLQLGTRPALHILANTLQKEQTYGTIIHGM